MLESDHWRDLLHNVIIDEETGHITTPMRCLIKCMPQMANLALERCAETNGEQAGSEDLKITYNYEFLDDLFTNYRDKGINFYDFRSCQNLKIERK